MPKIVYIEKSFRDASLALIERANTIIEDYEQQGYDLTLRQLYYRFVAADIIPNNERSYKNLGNLISDARMAGMIDWYSIVDRTRNLRANAHWSSPAQIVKACASQFAVDTWEGQRCRVEIWVEKDALIGVVAKAAQRLDVPYFSCRGYTSQSELWSAAQRHIDYGKKKGANRSVIIHLGDHDPSGIDMTRDIEDRMAGFGARGVFVERIALNMDQIRRYNPPPNPAKLTDARAIGYIREHGYSSWELDALEPSVLDRLIQDNVDNYVLDREMMNERLGIAERGKKELSAISDKYDEVVSSFL